MTQSHRIAVLLFASARLAAADHGMDGPAEIARYIRAQDWAEVLPLDECHALLESLRTVGRTRTVSPRLRADSKDSSRLSELSRCSEYKRAERAEEEVPNNNLWGSSDLGDRNFLLYRVSTLAGGGISRAWDIVYAEFDEEEVMLNAYFDGFTVVDLQTCRRIGGVTAQRPMKGDATYGAVRDTHKGLYEIDGHYYVVTASEMLGRAGNPDTTIGLNAWRLAASGKFALACAWHPKIP